MFTLPIPRKDAYYIQFHLTENCASCRLFYYSWGNESVNYYMNWWEAEMMAAGIAEVTV